MFCVGNIFFILSIYFFYVSKTVNWKQKGNDKGIIKAKLYFMFLLCYFVAILVLSKTFNGIRDFVQILTDFGTEIQNPTLS